jgi:hypothetical protein
MNAGMTIIPPMDPISCTQSVYSVSFGALKRTPPEKHASETGFEMLVFVHTLSNRNSPADPPATADSSRIQVGFIPEHALVQVSKYFQLINWLGIGGSSAWKGEGNGSDPERYAQNLPNAKTLHP